ncbi:MAG: succinate dehydrogenase, cytochrome b556 subunit [Betaproteobacteria bacterium]|nr:MAG: succinate dehydrogenase, cytochrome b556 subunit [Betaproteobacteria bacterium]TDI82575.1 MAG: succinate dehydrogenase, cytochrome b556 subunit [Betaproteobacteria bacterium]
MHRKRPKHLNLMEIKLPLPAVISILHRVSGVLLFFPGIPILLYSLQMVLDSPQSHDEFQILLTSLLVKSALILFLWFFMHHFCAGIRYLVLDLNYGIELEQARMSSKLVFVVGIVLTLWVGTAIW